MSDRPTPETDANLREEELLTRGLGSGGRITRILEAGFARRLERQRDEAVELLLEATVMLETSDGYGVRCPSPVNGRAWLLRAGAFLARLEKERK